MNKMSFVNFQNQFDLRNKTTFFGAIIILLVVGLACESSKNANVNPTNQTTTPKATLAESNTNSASQPIKSKPTSTVVAYNSGGLGLDRAAWESSQGTGKPNTATDSMFYTYGDGKFNVQFYPLESGNVRHIERSGGDSRAVPIEDARKEGKNFVPADAKFMRTYTASSGSTVDLI